MQISVYIGDDFWDVALGEEQLETKSEVDALALASGMQTLISRHTEEPTPLLIERERFAYRSVPELVEPTVRMVRARNEPARLDPVHSESYLDDSHITS